MGALFEKVADNVLPVCGRDECHLCGKTGRPIFTYFGTIVDPALSRYPDELDVEELCADCIKSGNVECSSLAVDDFTASLRRMGFDPSKFVYELKQLPRLPLFQGQTWPVCCNQLATYIGNAEPDLSDLDRFTCWEPMNDVVGTRKVIEFYPLEELSVALAINEIRHALPGSKRRQSVDSPST